MRLVCPESLPLSEVRSGYRPAPDRSAGRRGPQDRSGERNRSESGSAKNGARVTTDKQTGDDYDSPWKEALEDYLEPFLALFFPENHTNIDWSRVPECLD